VISFITEPRVLRRDSRASREARPTFTSSTSCSAGLGILSSSRGAKLTLFVCLDEQSPPASPGARHQPSPAGSRMLFFRFQGRGERTHGCENAPASEGHPRSKSLSAIEVWFKIHSPAPPRPVSRRVFQLDVTDDNLLDFEKVAVGCENRKAVLHGRGCDPEFIGAIGAPASHRAFRIAA